MQTITTATEGREVRIIAEDSDPSAYVWVCYLDSPDEDAMLPQHELVRH